MKGKAKRKLVLTKESLRSTEGGAWHRTTLRCHDPCETEGTNCCDSNTCFYTACLPECYSYAICPPNACTAYAAECTYSCFC